MTASGLSEWIVVALLVPILWLEIMDRQDKRVFDEILLEIERLKAMLVATFEARKLEIFRLGATMPTNNSIEVGQSGVFEVSPLPAGSTFVPGNAPKWAASDAAVQLAPSENGTQVTVTIPATNTNPSFDLGVSYTRQTDSQTITAKATVTVTQPAPPPATEPSSVSISQIS